MSEKTAMEAMYNCMHCGAGFGSFHKDDCPTIKPIDSVRAAPLKPLDAMSDDVIIKLQAMQLIALREESKIFLRDRFAMAALTGLMSRENDGILSADSSDSTLDCIAIARDGAATMDNTVKAWSASITIGALIDHAL